MLWGRAKRYTSNQWDAPTLFGDTGIITTTEELFAGKEGQYATDGSLDEKGAGCAVVAEDDTFMMSALPGEQTVPRAEAYGVLLALLWQDVEIGATVHTDSKNAIDNVNKIRLDKGNDPRLWRRMENYALLYSIIAAVIEVREGRGAETELVHVKSHTSSEDLPSMLNAAADWQAKEARGHSCILREPYRYLPKYYVVVGDNGDGLRDRRHWVHAPLFVLDDATLAVRVEANNLLYSTLELMIDPMSPAAGLMDSSHPSFPADGKRVLLEFARRMIPAGDPFQGQADMLSIRISAGVDPHDKIRDFNAASEGCEDTGHTPGRGREGVVHQGARHHLLPAGGVPIASPSTINGPPMTSSQFSNGYIHLRTMVLDLKRQLAALVNSANSDPSSRGFTPRADKPDRRVKTRFAASPLPKEGNWSQSVSKKVAFHRDTGATVCAKGKARHWHRDCPNGGRTGLSAYAFAEEAENSVLAAKFQHAIDHDDAVEFDAICVLAGGKPDIFADISACSFCEEDGDALMSAVTEFSELARTVGASTFNVNTFTANMPVVSELATHSPPASVESDEEWTGPPNPFCPPVTRTFADFIESTGVALGTSDEPPMSMNMLSAIEAPESVVSYEPAAYATDDDDEEDASAELPRPRYGCGRGLPGLGRYFLTSSLVCALFVICAAAAPHAVSGVGGANASACAAPSVGGAARTVSAVPTTATAPPQLLHGMPGDAMGGAMPDAISPRRQARYRELREGFRFYGFLPLPPELVDPDPPVPSSPPYSPPPYSSDDEAQSSEGSAADIVDSLIPSTNDLQPASEADNYSTLTLLRAGRPLPSSSSG
ncbi:hypothetical protein CYMTET_9908 [Cymbomonas tetramitiformis]|uniref:PLD phosphodiesterase domain-containing protein n=1 Tax=Cymbomonas tetramitiformis TaxID=36881 RepID=A0AAE0LF02_9CHLO|nr:hypothetical protein CYMTET_9908 [Cymbomonas tetramitiformis]